MNTKLDLESLFETLSPKELDTAYAEFSSRLKLLRTGDRIHALHGCLQRLFDTKQEPLSTQDEMRKKHSNHLIDFLHDLYPSHHAYEAYQPTHSRQCVEPRFVNLFLDPSKVADFSSHHRVEQHLLKNEYQPLELSPIQQIRLALLTQTDQGKDTMYTAFESTWQPDRSPQDALESYLRSLSALSQWVLTEQFHVTAEPPHCTERTAQTNNDGSSQSSDQPQTQQPT